MTNTKVSDFDEEEDDFFYDETDNEEEPSDDELNADEALEWDAIECAHCHYKFSLIEHQRFTNADIPICPQCERPAVESPDFYEEEY